MDIQWGSEGSKKFITNVGLITSNGPYGNNVMAAEWTHHVSYSPGMIMVNVGFDKATEANIKKTKEFGVSIAAANQNVAASVAGGSSGKEIDKIKILKELGIEFYKAKKIDALMIKGAALNVECKLVKMEKLGDHMMFVGEAVDVHAGEEEPVAYHGGKYYRIGEMIQKPPQKVLDKISELAKKYRK
ncbi:flavin reductase family protein [Candidatus Woesearchaeota archaeon]|nr:flavin reductase family protein [Candidatus Woesearchaeota archaeon]